MLRKSFTLRAPLDQFAVPLEAFLVDVSKNTLRQASGTYVGDGTASHKIMSSFAPSLVIIQKTIDIGRQTSYPVSNHIVVSILANVGVSWVSDVGFVKDAVLSSQHDGFTIGSNANVNSGGIEYTYFIVG